MGVKVYVWVWGVVEEGGLRVLLDVTRAVADKLSPRLLLLMWGPKLAWCMSASDCDSAWPYAYVGVIGVWYARIGVLSDACIEGCMRGLALGVVRFDVWVGEDKAYVGTLAWEPYSCGYAIFASTWWCRGTLRGGPRANTGNDAVPDSESELLLFVEGRTRGDKWYAIVTLRSPSLAL
jgi:hypothetical protein